MSWQVPISMRIHSNTIFITGGSSGIGRGLAEAFHKLGNQVIISGRREAALMAICEANPGMRSFVLDVTDPAAVREIARHVAEEFPDHCCQHLRPALPADFSRAVFSRCASIMRNTDP